MAHFGRNALLCVTKHVARQPLRAAVSRRSIMLTPKTLAAQVTQPAPDFKGTAVVDGEFKDIALSDYAGKYLVLFFYPLDFSFLCPTEVTAFSDRLEEFEAINASVVAVSTDSRFSHLALVNTPRSKLGTGPTHIPLLSDFCKDISRNYGVLLEQAGIALRGLFIIDAKGTVRHSSVNDIHVGRSVDETLRLVQAFQFTDEHGELCPPKWSPGGKSVKPTIDGANDYFKELD